MDDCVCACVSVCVCMVASMPVCTQACMNIRTFVICVVVCTCEHMYEYICLYVYVCTIYYFNYL